MVHTCKSNDVDLFAYSILLNCLSTSMKKENKHKIEFFSSRSLNDQKYCNRFSGTIKLRSIFFCISFFSPSIKVVDVYEGASAKTIRVVCEKWENFQQQDSSGQFFWLFQLWFCRWKKWFCLLTLLTIKVSKVHLPKCEQTIQGYQKLTFTFDSLEYLLNIVEFFLSPASSKIIQIHCILFSVLDIL